MPHRHRAAATFSEKETRVQQKRPPARRTQQEKAKHDWGMYECCMYVVWMYETEIEPERA